MKDIVMKLLEYLLSLFDKKEIRKEFLEVIPEPKTSVVNSLIQEPVNQSNNNPVIVKQEFKMVEKFLPSSQYVQDSNFKPNQIVLHHTNGHSWQSTYNYWMSNPDRICTHFLIDRDGTIVQCIPLEKAWGFHINIAAKDNKVPINYKRLGRKYDLQSIGIELCSMSQLVPYGDKFLDTYGKMFKGEVTKLDKPFRGFQHFESYTEKQISALESLLLHLLEEYPLIKNGIYEDYGNKFDINPDALNMKPGVYFHVNYRTGTKWDLYPHPQLIQMLNQLKSKI